MSTTFSSALSRLDVSLESLRQQVDCLGAALEDNEHQFDLCLIEARADAAMLRDMVRAKRPDAQWRDCRTLTQLVHELESEIAAEAAPVEVVAQSSAPSPATSSRGAGANASEQTSGTPEPEPAIEEFERLRQLLVPSLNGKASRPHFLSSLMTCKKPLLVCGSVVAALLFCILLGLVTHFKAERASRLRERLVAAGADMVGIHRTPAPDSEIQKDLESKLATIKGSLIQATVQDGVVTLVGYSPSKWDSLHAESLASQTAGVKAVINYLQIQDLPDVRTDQPDKSVAAKNKRLIGR